MRSIQVTIAIQSWLNRNDAAAIQKWRRGEKVELLHPLSVWAALRFGLADPRPIDEPSDTSRTGAAQDLVRVALRWNGRVTRGSKEDGLLTAPDPRTTITTIEALWSYPEGPLSRLRAGEISDHAVDQVVAALMQVELDPDARELDRLMVALLWNIPLLVEEQKERVLERGGDERTYQRLRGAVFAEVERVLGMGHVDHDVCKWFGSDA